MVRGVYIFTSEMYRLLWLLRDKDKQQVFAIIRLDGMLYLNFMRKIVTGYITKFFSFSWGQCQ